jgi:hypothetical protein
MPNIRLMTMDEDHFPEPALFCPDRWIKNPTLPLSVWGFGRRICPGRYLALKSMFFLTSRLLWGFNIQSPSGVNRDSLECIADRLIYHGVTEESRHFDAIFEVRDEKHRHLITECWKDAERTDMDSILDEIGQSV